MHQERRICNRIWCDNGVILHVCWMANGMNIVGHRALCCVKVAALTHDLHLTKDVFCQISRKYGISGN